MTPINAHKGGMELVTHVRGAAAHASKPDNGVNAIFAASKIIGFIEQLAAECAGAPVAGSAFDPPHTTLSVGTIRGGEARNVIPEGCSFDWEIRAHPGADPHDLRRRVQRFVEEEVLPAMTARNPGCEVVTEMLLDAPPLVATPESEAEALVARLWTNRPPSVVSFGTDGAFFQKAGLDTIVIGPGGMAQMHQPDEFITEEAMDEGLQFLERLLDEMSGRTA